MDMSATPGSGLSAGLLVGGGRYQLQRVLGQGGMGEVWLALDSRLGEQVALKFLPPKIRGDSVALQDMRRETLKSHRLTHSNIIRIHDLFESPDEAYFISMEYISGQNLHHLRAEQPHGVFAWDYLRPLVQQLCEALQYAHEEGVIHRDLKPANMMLDAKGRLKLADFGIAAVINDSAQREAQPHATSGTLTHMSPQQMQGRPPSVTDDIYALGTTLYELLASKPPFHKGDILGQVLDTPAPPLRDRLWELAIENPIPDDVVSLIMACLSKDPAQRPQSVADIAMWLGLPARGASATQTIIPPTPEPKEPAAPRRSPLPALVGLLLLGAVGFAGWQGWEKFLRPANLQAAWTEPARWHVVQETPLPDSSWSLPWVMPDGSGIRAASFNSEPGGTEAVPVLRSNLRWLTNPDGQTWQPGQKAFPHGIIRWNYESEFANGHAIGQREGDGWIARGGRGHMVYGPYRKFPGSDYRAFFQLQTDKIEPAGETLGYVDVARNSGISLVIIGVKRGDFKTPNTYHTFEVGFRCTSDQPLEFRTHYEGRGSLKQDNVLIIPQAGYHKALDRITLGSVYEDQGTWFYVYQGLGELQGTICLATSTNGQTFLPLPTNPILRPTPNAWDKHHLGAPVLHREGATWHLFYASYEGGKTALGVAYGNSLTALQKHSNPVLQPSGDTNRWDATGYGRISQVLKEGNVYYAASEGYVARPGGQSEWRVGLIQSTNLLEWTAASAPITGSMDFLASSPSLLSVGGKPVLYVQQMGANTNATLSRLELAPPK